MHEKITFDLVERLIYTCKVPREIKKGVITVILWNRFDEMKKEICKWLNCANVRKKACIWTGILLIPASLLMFPIAAAQKAAITGRMEQQVIGPREDTRASAGSGREEPAGPVNNGEGSSVSRGEIDRSTVYLLARLIEGEAADEPYEGKVAVGAVVVNRTKSSKFPRTIPGVIYQADAFESVSNGQINRPLSRDSLDAAVDALNGKDPTGGALYFWNPATSTSPWVWSRPVVTRIGGHMFAR